MFHKLKRYLCNPKFALGCDLIKKHPNWMSDRFFIETEWQILMGYKLNLKVPKTFNEKLQYLKLYDRNPLYTKLVDKVLVKDWVAEKIGAEYIIPTLAIWECAEDIDISQLPDQFVLKCNHDSGSIIICKDKSTFDITKAKEKLSKALKQNYYWNSREWVYKDIRPLIFAEPYIIDYEKNDLPDYKFFSFDGKVKVLFIATERASKTTEVRFDFFDMDFNHLNVENGHPNANKTPKKTKCFDRMIRSSEILSRGIPHVRCDFYEANGKMYFGELTFYHWSGFVPFQPYSFDEYLGDFIRIK